MNSATTLTILKMLGNGRGLQFVAQVVKLPVETVRQIAEQHDVLSEHGILSPRVAELAAAHIEATLATARSTLPTREEPAVATVETKPAPARPAPPPVPRATESVARTTSSVAAPALATGDVLLDVDVARLRPDPDNPRTDVGDVTELAASLRAVGLLQPIIARRTAAGHLIVVAGHRRLAAARLAGWTRVQVLVRRDMRPDDVLAAMLVENSHPEGPRPDRGGPRLRPAQGAAGHDGCGRRAPRRPPPGARRRASDPARAAHRGSGRAAPRPGEGAVPAAQALARPRAGRRRHRVRRRAPLPARPLRPHRFLRPVRPPAHPISRGPPRMTITAKLNPGLAGGGRSDSLNEYAERLYDRAFPLVAIVEIKPVDKTMPMTSDSKKDGVVRLQIDSFEVAAPGEQESTVRDLLRLLNMYRTAEGTLDGDNEVKLLEQTLAKATDLLAAEQVASLVAILDWVLTRLGEIAGDEKLRPVDVRKILGQVAGRAAAARLGVQGKDGPSW